MKVSSRVDYALSCILRVADRYGDRRPVAVKEVAEKENLEPDYAEQLLIIMKRAGLLKSVRGKSGGYLLAKPPDKIVAKAVVLAINKDVLKLVCFRKKGRQGKCAHYNDCKVRVLWEGLRDSMASFLDTYNLEELLNLRRKEKKW